MWITKKQLTNSIGQVKEYVDTHDSKLEQAQAQSVPHIDAATKHWFIGSADTGIVAEGQDGVSGSPGEPGPQGAQEERGERGLPGQDGKDGITPHIGGNGNWFIGDTDTKVPAKGQDGQPGEQGPQGSQGLPGADGQDGITPHIGEGGNWFIGDVDTGVSAGGTAVTDEEISEEINDILYKTEIGDN